MIKRALGCGAVFGGLMAVLYVINMAPVVDAGVAALVGQLGGCDAVVANAGVVDTIHRAERFPEADWQKDVETNLTINAQ